MRYAAWYTRTTSHNPLCTAAAAAATWLTNGIIGLANHVTSGMPSADWTQRASGIDPQMPSTSAGPRPVSRSTLTHASAASDPGLRPLLRGTKPVVAAPAKATRSFSG